MRNFSKFALCLLSTLVAGSALAQCPVGSPCSQRNWNRNYSYSSPNYSYSSPNYSYGSGSSWYGQNYYQQPSYDSGYGYSHGPYEINYPSYPDSGMYQSSMHSPVYYENFQGDFQQGHQGSAYGQPNWSHQGYGYQQGQSNWSNQGYGYQQGQPNWSNQGYGYQQSQPNWSRQGYGYQQGQPNYSFQQGSAMGDLKYYEPNAAENVTTSTPTR